MIQAANRVVLDLDSRSLRLPIALSRSLRCGDKGREVERSDDALIERSGEEDDGLPGKHSTTPSTPFPAGHNSMQGGVPMIVRPALDQVT